MTPYNNDTLNVTYFYCDDLYSASALLVLVDTSYCFAQNNRSVRHLFVKYFSI